MKLPNFFEGRILCDFFNPLKPSEITDCSYHILIKHRSMLVYDNYMNLAWYCEYVEEDDSYAITNHWSKAIKRWGVSSQTKYADRLRVKGILSDDSFEKYADSNE